MIVSNNVKVIATIASIAVLSCASSVSYGKIKHSETRSTEVREVGIRGIIIDKANADKLVGVVVVPDGNTNAATLTDANGNFHISTNGVKSLRVSCVGYVTKTIQLNKDIQSDKDMEKRGDCYVIALDEDYFKINEVVVTGQGAEINKRRLSSNISTVDASDLEKVKVGRIDQMLQNALPNVQINITTGQPGSTSMVKSRGLSSAFINSTPVIYVDGVRVDNMNSVSSLNNYTGTSLNSLNGQTATYGSISDIPMENIDHIEYVTGGAATTVYGSDAANGVIQIFTKKGSNNKISFYAGADLGADVASSQFYHFKRTKELLHQTGFQQKYRFGFDGGTDKYGYSFGASMSENTGTLIHDGNKDRKYDMRFGSHVKFNRMLEYQNSFGFVVEDYNRRRNGNEGWYTGLWFAEGSACANFKYVGQDGVEKNYGADIDALDDYTFGKMKEFVSKAEALQNNKESIKRFQTSQSLEFKPIRDFTMKATLGVDYRVSSNKLITTNEFLIHIQQKPEGTSNAGSISNFDRKYFGLTADINAQDKLRYKDWLSSITTAGFQFFSTNDHQSVYNGSNVRDGAQIIAGAGTLTANEWLSYLYNYGAFVQENIGICDRYYIDLGLRSDYNTAFGDNVGWQCYPKVGLSYVMSDEPFMKPLTQSGILNNLRLMANYGVAGSYPPAFEYQRTVDLGSYNDQQAAYFGKYGNPNLAPEKKHSYEVGLNSTLFNNVLNIGITYYYALTKDALFYVPSLPSSGQASNYLANVGKIENKGVELSLGVQVLNTKDWKLRVNASLNTNKNKVLDIGTAVPFAIGGFSSRTIQTVVAKGKPVGFLRGSKAELNDDGSLKDVLNLQDLGTTLPTKYGNFSVNGSWRRLAFFISGDWQTGAYVHSFDRQFRFAKGLKDPAIPDKALEGKTQAKEWLNFTNFFVEKSDFLKIRNIGVSYDWSFKQLIKTMTVGFNVYNPFAITASSVDPEATISGTRTQGAVAVGGLNYSSYSTPRSFIGSVTVTF